MPRNYWCFPSLTYIDWFYPEHLDSTLIGIRFLGLWLHFKIPLVLCTWGLCWDSPKHIHVWKKWIIVWVVWPIFLERHFFPRQWRVEDVLTHPHFDHSNQKTHTSWWLVNHPMSCCFARVSIRKFITIFAAFVSLTHLPGSPQKLMVENFIPANKLTISWWKMFIFRNSKFAIQYQL